LIYAEGLLVTVRGVPAVASSSSSRIKIRFAPFEFDPVAGELQKSGGKIKLQGQPIEILALLLERPGILVRREELQRRLWPDNTFVDFENSLNAAIKRLRAALSDSPDKPRFIETLARRGYRFIGAVEVAELTEAKSPIRSLAVLPLANLSGDPQQDYFADGMTEELVTQLGRISALRVVSRTSSMTYKTTNKQLPEIARELHVDGIVEGSVLRSGNRVRITAQLIEASTDHHLWAQDYEGDMRDVLSLQGRVAQAIAGKIQAKLKPDEQKRLASKHTMDPEAYDDYLRGRYYWYDSIGRGVIRLSISPREGKGIAKSGAYFQRAVEKDPASALAYIGLASYYGASAAHGLIAPKEGYPYAEIAAQKALELDSSLAEAHHMMGAIKRFYHWDFAGAEKEFLQAIELNPSYPETHRLYEDLLATLGRPEECLAQAKIAEELDPITFQGTTAGALIDLRRYDGAIAEFKEILRLNDSSTVAHYGLATAYLGKGMDKEAMEETLKALLLAGDTAGADMIKTAYEVGGYKEVIHLRLRQLQQKSKTTYVSALDFAELYSELGSKKEAFAWLEKAYDERASFLCLIGIFSSFDKIRDDPRFKKLLQKLGLPTS